MYKHAALGYKKIKWNILHEVSEMLLENSDCKKTYNAGVIRLYWFLPNVKTQWDSVYLS